MSGNLPLPFPNRSPDMSNTPTQLARLSRAANLPPFTLPGVIGRTNTAVPTQGLGPRSASRGTQPLAAVSQQREILNTCVRANEAGAAQLVANALSVPENANISIIGPGTLDLTALAGATGLAVRGKNAIYLSRGARLAVDTSADAAADARLFNLIQGSALDVLLCPGLALAGIDITSGATAAASLAQCAGDNVAALAVLGVGSVNISGGTSAVGVTHATATPGAVSFSSVGTIAWTFAAAAGGVTSWTWYPAAGAPFDVPGEIAEGASFAELQRFSSRILRDAVILITAFEAARPPRWIATGAAQNVRASISGGLAVGGAVVASYFDVLTDEEATSSEITLVYSFTVAAAGAVIAPLLRALAPGGTPRGRLANVFLQSTTDAPITGATSVGMVAQSVEDIFLDATAHTGPVDVTGTINLEADGIEMDGINDFTLGASDVDAQIIADGVVAITTFDLRRLVLVDATGGNAHTLTFNRAGLLILRSNAAAGSTVAFAALGTVGTLGPTVDRLIADGFGGGGVTFTLTFPVAFDIKTAELEGGVSLTYAGEIGLIFELSIGTAADDVVSAAAATALSAIARIVANAFPGGSVVGAAVVDAAPLVGRTAF